VRDGSGHRGRDRRGAVMIVKRGRPHQLGLVLDLGLAHQLEASRDARLGGIAASTERHWPVWCPARCWSPRRGPEC